MFLRKIKKNKFKILLLHLHLFENFQNYLKNFKSLQKF